MSSSLASYVHTNNTIDYVDQQKFISRQIAKATVHNNNFVGIASYNIFVGVYVATIFGSAFFFDLFWPERYESPSVKLAWRLCSIFACMLTLSCALAYTDIVATQSAFVTGTNAAESQQLLAKYGGSPLRYRENGRAIASVVFLWPGTVFTFVRYVYVLSLSNSRTDLPCSTYLLWHSLAHIDAHGPKSAHARTRDSVEGQASEKPTSLAESTFDASTLA